jgi:hypothetical protein
MKWLAILLLAAAPLCAGTAVDEATKRFDAAAAKVPGNLGSEFRMLGCKTLKATGCQTLPPTLRPESVPFPQEVAIRVKLRTVRGLPTDADRGRVIVEVARSIRALPAEAPRLSYARGLCSLVTEGDLGQEALSSAAGV